MTHQAGAFLRVQILLNIEHAKPPAEGRGLRRTGVNYALARFSMMAAWAAARRAIGTRNGEQLT